VISRIIQRLTLIAFTAHAVLGCCWHHSHAIGSECCGEHIAVETEDADHHHRCCCHSHDESPVEDSIDDGGSDADFFVESVCCEESHSHSHQCNEAHCSFVPCNAKQLDFEISDFSINAILNGEIELSCLAGQLTNRVDLTLFDEITLSSLHRCAVLQSWQI
jgi:hypothetical protein